jgi:hypothetical protein
MGGAWFLLGFVIVGSNRWFRVHWKYSQSVHNYAGSIATVGTLYSGIEMIISAKTVKINTHSIIGVVLTALTLILALFGWISYLLRDSRYSTSAMMKIGQIHAWMGILLFLLGFAAIASGLWSYFNTFNRNLTYLAPVSLGVLTLLTLGLEVRYRVQMRRKDKLGKSNSLYPFIAAEEFRDRILKGE